MAVWYLVIEKFEKKLSAWKRRTLSLGGKITLTKACVSNLLVYFMSPFKMPKIVEPKLDRIRRNFLVGGTE